MKDVPLPVLAASDGAAGVLHEAVRSGRIRGEVRTGWHDRMLYATDASIYQVEPLAVVIPADEADLESIVEFCAEHALPVLPRGGGTSLAGQTVGRAVVVDAGARLRSIRSIDPERRIAVVEPGVVLDQLNVAAAAHGLRFGPDVATSSHATLGGMIGNNSAGANSVLYGRTVDHVRAIEAVLAGGLRVRFDRGAAARDPRVHDLTRRVAEIVRSVEKEIDERFPKILRRVDGYNLDLVLAGLRASASDTFDQVNLAQLLCGSEGTLAVTASAEVDLVPLPKLRALGIVAFPGVQAALEAVQEVLETAPAAVELVDDVIIRLAEENFEYRRYVDLLPSASGRRPEAVLYVEYFRDSQEALDQAFAHLITRFGADAVQVHRAPEAILRAWKLRKAGEPLLHGIPGARKPITFIEDTAVDPSHLPKFIERFREIVQRHGTIASYYAHASVGCLHVRPLVNLREPADFRMMQSIMEEVTQLVVEYGGSLSGEHGDGRLRSHQLEAFFGPAVTDALKRIKAVFDPDGRMNPGVIVDPVPMTEALRVRPQSEFVEAPQTPTFFRYEREHGLLGAAEMCNGAGVCRRISGGVMCPSYRGTLDERHATRGRGNALRLAITGQQDPRLRTDRWNDEETLRTLDLCLSCKACKRECPSNVDIAKLKAEYLAQGFRARGRATLRAWMFGNVRALNRAASIAPRLANAVQKLSPVRAVLNRVMGLHPARQLPSFAPSLAGALKRGGRPRGDDRPVVLLQPDCFTLYNEPTIGLAARDVLEAFGYRVELAPGGCCGRAQISTGLLPAAMRTIVSTLTAHEAALARPGVIGIVGLEPSCVSAALDEWGELNLSIPVERVRGVTERIWSIEQFLESRWEAHPQRPALRSEGATSPLVVHGHCHQKALWGTEDLARLLRRFGDPHQSIDLLDSGCCGMAGSFGYAAHRYDLSMRIGEASLFRLVRDRTDATLIVPGTSCRHQLSDGLSRCALHPIEWIAPRVQVPGAPS